MGPQWGYFIPSDITTIWFTGMYFRCNCISWGYIINKMISGCVWTWMNKHKLWPSIFGKVMIYQWMEWSTLFSDKTPYGCKYTISTYRPPRTFNIFLHPLRNDMHSWFHHVGYRLDTNWHDSNRFGACMFSGTLCPSICNQYIGCFQWQPLENATSSRHSP